MANTTTTKPKAKKAATSAKQKRVPRELDAPEKSERKKANGSAAGKAEKPVKTQKTKPKVNCQLPGAEMLAKGKSVKEVMKALESELDPKQERFCQEYVSCGIGVRAALRVWPELSYDVAHNKAYRLLQNAPIQCRVKQIETEHKERYGLTDSKILKRLAALAMFDRRTLHKEDGTIKQIHELTEEEAAAITEIESVELFEGRGEQRTAIGIVRKVKFADPKGSIELAGKHLKLWKEVGSDDNPIKVVGKIELVPLT